MVSERPNHMERMTPVADYVPDPDLPTVSPALLEHLEKTFGLEQCWAKVVQAETGEQALAAIGLAQGRLLTIAYLRTLVRGA